MRNIKKEAWGSMTSISLIKGSIYIYIYIIPTFTLHSSYYGMSVKDTNIHPGNVISISFMWNNVISISFMWNNFLKYRMFLFCEYKGNIIYSII